MKIIVNSATFAIIMDKQKKAPHAAAATDNTADKIQDTTYALNEFFAHQFQGICPEAAKPASPKKETLVTARHGGWLILNDEEFAALRRLEGADGAAALKELSPLLFSKLENEGIIISQKSAKGIVSRLKARCGFLNFGGMLYIINITSRCNLKCDYCYAAGSSGTSAGLGNGAFGSVSDSCGGAKDMDEKTMDAAADFIMRMPHKKISLTFQGGEPLLRPDIIRAFLEKLENAIAKRRAENNENKEKTICSKVIVSNLACMSEDIAEFILKNDIGLSASFDGPKKLHDSQRKDSAGCGTYDCAARWINYFKSKGRIIRLIPTITSKTLSFGPDALINEYLKYGVTDIHFRPVHALGRASLENGAKNGIAMGASEYADFWMRGIEYLLGLNSKGVYAREITASAMLANILTPHMPYMCMRTPCGMGISTLSIGPDGAIHACDIAKAKNEFKLGDVFNADYADIFLRTLEYRARTCESIPLCGSCAFSPFCGLCPCRTYAQFKDITARTPESWDCKVNKKMFEYLFSCLADKKRGAILRKWIERDAIC